MTENKDKQNQKQKQQQQKQRQQRNSSGSGSSSSKTNEHLENGIAAAAVNDDDSCEGAVGGSDDRAQQQQQQQQQPQQQRQQQQQQQQQLPPLDERPSTSAGCSRIRNCVATNTDFVTNREHDRDKEPHDSSERRTSRLTQFMELLPISMSVSCKNLACGTSPSAATAAMTSTTATVTPVAAAGPAGATGKGAASSVCISGSGGGSGRASTISLASGSELAASNLNRTISFQSEEFLWNMLTDEIFSDLTPALRSPQNRDEFGTQRVYKKTSPNCVLTLYLPSREITLTGNSPSVLRGIVFVDPKAIQGYRVYTQLTLTFRYGREDEEVMGLRFCNEAIMSLHQIWPRNEEPARESLSPLQEALVKRLGEGAHPFTLSLTSQAPPSVQLVPAKRYYGAPIGTSYDVRCFIVDKTDEKFHRRASVKMGVRVIYRTDVFQQNYMPENFAALLNNQAQSPPGGAGNANAQPANAGAPGGSGGQTADGPSTSSNAAHHNNEPQPSTSSASGSASASGSGHSKSSSRKSERGDSFPKLRLSPKSFRFSGRFGRSKSEIEKCPTDPFHNYSKSFQEPYDGHAMPNGSSGNNNIIAAGSGVSGGSGPNITGGPMPGCSLSSCAGPQAVVDKPFLLQDGRVNLRASLDKAWYTHGEDVNVTVHVRNDSRKTVRKVRVCAIQHVDVCMFNNGKFKNVVADSDTASPADRTVPPGSTLHTIIALRPQRGPTKNWIALEDTLQRSTEPEEITGVIAASAIRSPNLALQIGLQCSSPAVGIPHAGSGGTAASGSQQQQNASGNSSGSGGSAHAHGDDRNVFAIYVSYYVKVKLTLSSMGGEVSLKLPFVLVHIDDGTSGLGSQTLGEVRLERLALHDVPANRKNGSKTARAHNPDGPSTSKAAAAAAAAAAAGTTGAATATNGLNHALLDRIESVDDVEFNIRVPIPANGTGAVARNGSNKRRLLRSETIAKDLDEAEEEVVEVVAGEEIIDVLVNDNAGDDDDADAAAADDDDEAELEGAVGGQSVNSTDIGVGDGDVFMESVHFVQVHTIIEHEYDNVGYGHAPIPAPASAQAQGAIKKKSNNNNNNNNNGNENDSANNERQSHGQREPNV